MIVIIFLLNVLSIYLFYKLVVRENKRVYTQNRPASHLMTWRLFIGVSLACLVFGVILVPVLHIVEFVMISEKGNKPVS